MLSSARSPRVSAARRLTKRSFREQDRLFLAEGPQAVAEALAEEGAVVELFCSTDLTGRAADLADLARTSGLAVTPVSRDVMAALAQTVTPQGILAVARFRDVTLADAFEGTRDGAPRLVPILAAVRDPGNAGTVLRAADAAGADAVVFAEASVDPYNPKCVRASAGSLFHLPFVAGVAAAAAVQAARDAGMTVLAADAGAGAESLDDVDDAGGLSGPTAWLFGNEAWGLPDALRGLADRVVAVPIHGRAESLNLATAAAVCLYASARGQRRAGEFRAE
ncbi:MAG: methyltransferase, TrmH family [Frankiales bacterium]|nr:methyltransferase, TrmH family [Frankiales bacterium]